MKYMATSPTLHSATETVAQVATWKMEEMEMSSSGLVTPSKLVRKLCLS